MSVYNSQAFLKNNTVGTVTIGSLSILSGSNAVIWDTYSPNPSPATTTNWLTVRTNDSTTVSYLTNGTVVMVQDSVILSGSQPLIVYQNMKDAIDTATSMVQAMRSATFLYNVVSGPAATGTLAPSNPVFIGGTDGTNIRAIKTDTTGSVITRVTNDGINYLPTMDAITRRGYMSLTDGVNTAAIKAASTSPTVADPAVVVTVSPNSSITLSGSLINVPVQFGSPGTQDSFGSLATGNRIPQLQIPFYQATPSQMLNCVLNNGATVTSSLGVGTFTTANSSSSSVTATTYGTVGYTAHYEIYAAGTVAYASGTANVTQKFGLYDNEDGFSFGYNGATFGLWTRYNTVDTFIPQSSWNIDTLLATYNSKFTLNGAPTALIPTNMNLYRIRFGWLGIAPIVFEVLSPDGNFVVVHQTRYPNTQDTVSVTNPNMPLRLELTKTTTGIYTMKCGCWVAGTLSPSTNYIGGSAIITRNGGSVVFPATGVSAAVITVAGTWNGTIAFQLSADDGQTWVNDIVVNASTGAGLSTTTVNGTFKVSMSGYRQYRIVSTAWSSGTATVTYSGGAGIPSPSSIATTAQGGPNTINNAWPMYLTDKVNGPVTVRSGSTATTLDAALVVAMSPNTSVYVSGSSTPTDTFANPTLASLNQSFLMGWNGTTWDRVRVEPNNNDNEVPYLSGVLAVESYGMHFSGATWSRIRGNNSGTFVQGSAASGSSYTLAGNPLWIGAQEVSTNNISSLKTIGNSLVVRQFDGTSYTPGMYSLATRGYQTIGDASNAITIRSGSAATSTDTAMVVAIAPNNRVNVNTAGGSGTATLTNIPGAITSSLFLAANSARLGGSIQNDSLSVLYIKCGLTASATSYSVKMFTNDYWECPFGYTGRVEGVWDTVVGSARVTEYT